jgi:branched-chain amino acid transport system substrate-binding protein
MGWQPPYGAEARIYAEHILEANPNAKIGVLYQNDDFGKDYVNGFEEGLGDKAKSAIVAKVTYEVTDPTIDSQMLTLKASGADTFLNITTPKFAAQAIKKAAEIGWKPTQYITNVSISVSSVLKPAGFENATGIITALYGKDPTDPQWANDQGMKDWTAFMKQYYPAGGLTDANNVYGYSVAQTMVQVLKQCGDDLTRANVMKQAASLDLTLPMSLPGINIKTGPNDFFPIQREQLARFDGKTWVLFGKVYGP